MHPTRAWIALGLLGVAACASDAATDDKKFTDHYEPNQINASYGAFADDDNLRILAAWLGDDGFLRLRGGDTVEIAVDGNKMATYERVDDKIHYIVDMPPPRGATLVSITFVHGLERVVGTVKLAPPFDATAAATVKRGEKLDIAITPVPDGTVPGLTARASISGDCLEDGSQDLELCDKDGHCGRFPVVLDTTKLKLKQSGTNLCNLAVSVRLASNATPFQGEGPMAQSFKGGGFEGYRGKNLAVELQ